MFNRRNCDRKSSLSGTLTEPLNPRGAYICYSPPNGCTELADIQNRIGEKGKSFT